MRNVFSEKERTLSWLKSQCRPIPGEDAAAFAETLAREMGQLRKFIRRVSLPYAL